MKLQSHLTSLPRRDFLRGTLAAGAAACLSTPARAAAKQPNILFIFTDDHAPHAISAYGSKINKTPNLDRLAAEGMRFERCMVSNGICAPSRAVVLTGKHSFINGQMTNGDVFDGGQMTASQEAAGKIPEERS